MNSVGNKRHTIQFNQKILPDKDTTKAISTINISIDSRKSNLIPSSIKIKKDIQFPDINNNPYQKKVFKIKNKIKFNANIVKETKDRVKLKNTELIINQKMIDLLDYDENYDVINDLIFTNDDRDAFTQFNKTFNKTRYTAPESLKDFFDKYHEFPELQRKGTLTKMTPS